jgi:hypothetical protein
MSPRTRQQTSMVGQARTIAQPKQKKSKLPELVAKAAARKQQAFVPEPASISSEAPTPDPDRVVSRRAVNRAVEGLAQSAAALGGQPATVPHLQPTAPSPQARPLAPPAAGYAQGPGMGPAPGPQAAAAHAHAPAAHAHAHAPAAHASSSAAAHASPAYAPAAHASTAQAPQAFHANVPHAPPPAMGVAAPVRHARKRPKRRTVSSHRAILFGLIVGAVLSALLVVGLWMWISIRKGG